MRLTETKRNPGALNIIKMYLNASPEEITEGMYWYEKANQAAEHVAVANDVETETVAAVISALSPRNKWHRNLEDARKIVQVYQASNGDQQAVNSVKVGTFNRGKDKAFGLLDGRIEPHEAFATALKTKNFYESIMLRIDAICIDGHAYAIWLGERTPVQKTPSITPRMYEAIAQDYREATAVINSLTDGCLLPYQLQAITWVTYRNLHGIGQ